MEHILKSWQNTIRFIVLLLVIFFIGNLIINKFINNSTFDINFQNDKTLVTIIDKKNVIANSVLPACDTWSNTGIEIRPEEVFEIKVSGKIHASADKMISDAKDDIKPRYNWIGPEGTVFEIRPERSRNKSDLLRQKLLLNPNANLGAVLFYIQKENSKEPNCSIGSNQFIPKDSIIVYDTKKGYTGKNNSHEKWFLWATVNDILFRDMDNETSKVAYLGGKKGNDYIERLNKWEELKKEKYNRIWFDENFGNFVISAKIEKPVPLFGF